MFDYLLAENKRVASILGNNLFSSEDYIKSILQNNIYGVDLNDESVEITKLSLWLKTAQKGKKLTSLNNNIKCGNSLIESKRVAGDKAFDWASVFPEIFKSGGFNVIVGNPPYVATKQIAKADRDYYWDKYDGLLFSEMDLYEIFTYKMIDQILTKNGYLGFITPNSYFTNISFRHYRNYLLEKTHIKSIVDFPYRFFPFSDVNTETAILVLKKSVISSGNVDLWSIDKNKTATSRVINQYSLKSNSQIKQSDILNNYDGKVIINQDPVMTKMLRVKGRFGAKLELHKGWMSVPTETRVGDRLFETGIFNKSDVEQYDLGATCKRYIEGRDIHRYYIDKVEKYVNAAGMDKKTYEWHHHPKIVLQRIVGQNKNKIFATYDDSDNIVFPNANLLNAIEDESPKVYLPILNSKLISYFYNAYFGESNTNLTKTALEGIPLPTLGDRDRRQLTSMADLMIDKNKELNKLSSHFRGLVMSEFNLEKWPTRLNAWWRLDSSSFISTFKMSMSQKDDLIGLYDKYVVQCAELDKVIQRVDRDIEDITCRLYGLSSEEIDLVTVAR